MNSALPSRRDFLRNTLGGFGYLAFAGMSTQAANVPGAMFPARARRVIMMFMQGGVAHVDTFDYKLNLPVSCQAVDKPVGALLNDLRQRGMLEDTLVVFAGEFGRTPYGEGADGRDHNNRAFTIWMAGGGVKAGHRHGVTDEYGAEGVEGKVHIHDLHATMLHLLGLDHEKLTYRYSGRDWTLTDLKGNVVKEVIA